MAKTKTLQDAALTYLANGFSVIPVRRDKRKSPALEVLPDRKWKQFQKEPATSAQVKKWFASGEYNIGIICGEVSGNLVVIDFDKPSEFELIKAELPDTWVAQSGREGGGYHAYFRSDKPQSSYRLAEKNVEIRAEGNYVVAPPSIHFSGTTYKFLKQPKQIAAMPSLTALGLAQTDKTSDTKEREPNWVTKTMAGPVYESTLTVPEGALSGRDTLCTRLAGHFLRLLPKDEVELILINWGQTRCIPPFERVEVLKCVTSIDEKRGGDHGDLEVWTLGEFLKLDIPEVPELVNNWLRTKDVTLLVGGGGTGKSSIAAPMAMSLASGVPFLGFGVAKPEKTLYFDLEMGAYEVKVRTETLAKQYPTLAKQNFMIMTLPSFRVNKEGNLARLRRAIEEKGPKLFIVDNHAKFHSGDPNSERDMQDMIVDPLKDMMEDYDLAVLYLMHTPWKEKDRPRGSMSIFDMASTVVSITQGGTAGRNRVLKWTKNRPARREERTDSMTVVYNDETFMVERAEAAGVENDVLQDIDWPIGSTKLASIFQERLKIGRTASFTRVRSLIKSGDLVENENRLLEPSGGLPESIKDEL